MAQAVVDIWKKVNSALPIFDLSKVKTKVARITDKVRDANRKSLSDTKRANLERTLDTLFDICRCSCKLPIVPCIDRSIMCKAKDCTKTHVLCTCQPEMRVPLEESLYHRDQRSKRQPKGSYQLGSPEGKMAAKKPCTSATVTSLSQMTTDSSSSPSAAEPDDDEYEERLRGRYNLLKTPRFALEIARAGVSYRAGAAIFNSLIQDLEDGHLLDNRQFQSMNDIFFDHTKMKRQISAVAIRGMEDRVTEQKGLVCVGVDGKVDNKTLAFKEVLISGERKLKQTVEKEHHLVFTSESGELQGSYLTHTTLPLTGQMGELMARETHQVLKDTESLQSIRAILCDNTSTNTGQQF